MASASTLAGLLVFLAGWGGLGVWCVWLIRESAQGVRTSILWRDPSAVWHDLFDPLIRSSAAVLVSLAPVLILGSLGGGAAAAGLFLALAFLPIALGTLALGAVMIAFEPAAGLRRVRHQPRAYANVVLLSLLLAGGVILIHAFLADLPAGPAFVRVAVVFAATVLARSLGLFLRMTRSFRPGSPDGS